MPERTYYTLIASLPALPAQFPPDRSPITWRRLEERLKMLEDEDAAALARLVDFLAWDRQPSETTHSVVREIVDVRIDMRTIISGLRRRRLGWGPPPGAGRWVDHIRRRWNEPQFGLQARYPWIEELDRLLAAGQMLAAEKLILTTSWSIWSRAAADARFTFGAVLLYVARWSVVNRWACQNAVAGQERFDQSVATLVQDYVHFDN